MKKFLAILFSLLFIVSCLNKGDFKNQGSDKWYWGTPIEISVEWKAFTYYESIEKKSILTISGKIENLTDKKIELNGIYFSFYTKDKNLLAEISDGLSYQTGIIQPRESKDFNISVSNTAESLFKTETIDLLFVKNVDFKNTIGRLGYKFE